MGYKLYRQIRDSAPADWTHAERLVAWVIADDASDQTRRSWIKLPEIMARRREMSTDLVITQPTGVTCPEMFYDKIVLWRDVQSGDLVILDDALVIAVQVDVIQKPWGDGTTFPAVDVRHQLDNGCFVVSERHGNRLTAVRRPRGEK